jgi:hypothetical protein
MASAWSGGRARRKESTRAVDIAIPDTTAARKECRSRGAEIGKGVGIRIMLRPATKGLFDTGQKKAGQAR